MRPESAAGRILTAGVPTMGKRGLGAYRVPPLYDRNPPQDTGVQKGRGKAPSGRVPEDCLRDVCTANIRPMVVISNSPDSQTMDIPVWQLGVTDDMVLGRPILTTETGYNAGVMLYRIKGRHAEAEHAALQRGCIRFSAG